MHISVEPLFTRDQKRCTLLTKDTTTQKHAGGHDVRHSSRDVGVSPLRVSLLGLRHVEKVPDEDGVVVRAAHDLKLVELKTENTTRMFLLQTRKEEQ